MFIKILTVSALNNYVKKVIDNDFILNNAHVKGELSNVKIHSSGHIYFSLKDQGAKINCILFRNNAEQLTFLPREGMKVVVKGRVSVYEKEGAYQLYGETMQLDGEGELYVAFQKLKEKLEKEGLFEEGHKKTIPKYPKRIGIVTSESGAALRDIIHVARRRNSRVDLLISPTLVQGIYAGEAIAKAIERIQKVEGVELILLARGGGSLEELWAFNEEIVARAIYNAEIPIITGIGHETDYTIADFVSDWRAPTPSAAAEIAVASLEETNRILIQHKISLQRALQSMFTQQRHTLNSLKRSLDLHSPMQYIVHQYEVIDHLRYTLKQRVNTELSLKRQKLSEINALLHAHNPLNVLQKGYAFLQDENQKVIRSVEELKYTPKAKVTLKDGSGIFQLKYVEEETWQRNEKPTSK